MELPHIGATCVVCNRNDYLPFKCQHCTKIVCIDHKEDHGADCPLSRTSFDAKIDLKSPESIRQACDFCKKITLQLELSKCPHCHGKHCLYHRHQVQHTCAKLAEETETRKLEEAAKIQKQQEALSKLKAKQTVNPAREAPKLDHSVQTRLDPKKLALARRVNVMRIKQSARGPPNVLDQDKLFFEVEFIHNPESKLSNESKHGKKLNIYATKTHTVGRLVDFSSHELDITNKNQLHDSDQLVFQLKEHSNCTVLDSQATFQHYLDSGLLDSGDKLLMTHHKSSCGN
jgi:hypothetical protein